ncbi:hypothetical protein QS306_09435 [Paraburkholderia bonniea]|uniref:hypothetical protein n=1 Tax=Paraburkholderia bonniea TaxID=2152891 RepID=UPI0025735B3C|nr:hypothetical protein [Paraburkholderia bonniea]WJF89344.1 hypothetical protein QS306_09435 [Paraburkholderia bonniea]WJF92660.1 hypothetical protein QS308_09445 [Paraburkholderia bonniea]
MTISITALQALPPVSAMPLTQPVQGALAPHGVTLEPGAPGAAPEAGAIERFRQRLDAARVQGAGVAPGATDVSAPPSGVLHHSQHHAHGPSAVARIVAEQDHAFHALSGEVEQFSGAAESMTTQQAVAQSMKIQFQVSALTARLYIGQIVAQGSKNSVQTLMKNQ